MLRLKLLVLITFYFCYIASIAQDASITDTTLWIKTPLKFVTASVKMPYNTNIEKKDVYTSKGLQSMYYLKNEHKALELSFMVSMRQVSAKEYKKALQEEINRLAVQFGGYPNTFKEKDKNNLSYEYIIIYLSDRKTIASRVYFIDDYLIMLTTTAPEKDKFSLIVNYFLNSLVYTKFQNNSVSNNQKNKNKTNKTKTAQSIKKLEWISYENNNFEAYFPEQPNIKNYYIQNNNLNYDVKNYYYQDATDNSAYLISERKYAYALGITTDSLFTKAIQSIIKDQKSKIISEQYLYAYQFPTKEYIISSRKIYYRLRYYFANNTLYQVMYSGNKKQVFDLVNEKFFHQFVISQ